MRIFNLLIYYNYFIVIENKGESHFPLITIHFAPGILQGVITITNLKAGLSS